MLKNIMKVMVKNKLVDIPQWVWDDENGVGDTSFDIDEVILDTDEEDENEKKKNILREKILGTSWMKDDL